MTDHKLVVVATVSKKKRRKTLVFDKVLHKIGIGQNWRTSFHLTRHNSQHLVLFVKGPPESGGTAIFANVDDFSTTTTTKFNQLTNASLVQGFLVMTFCNVVTVITTFSMSAVSTNGQIKGGGVYFMISR